VQRLVAERLRLARERAVEAEAARAAAALVVDDLRARLAVLDADIAARQEAERAALARLADARARIVDRAAVAYVHGSLSRVETMIDARDANDFLRRVRAVRSVLDADNQAITDLRAATAAAGAELQRVLGERDELGRTVDDAVAELERRTTEAAIAGAGLSSLETGGVAVVNVGGFVFPIAGVASFTDTFGAPRMPGTTFAHSHQGTDVFAAAGTPLVAVERGVISRMGTDTLGGIKLWLQGASGTRYYYAHLSAYAEGLHQGQVVEAGALVGYVGNTGNARTTPPHLHFEVHPGGGPAANPYPLLRAVHDATAAARASLPGALTAAPPAG
jgi:murein DD-endopeptidase MepM/ murein hydrolase activator NlpD